MLAQQSRASQSAGKRQAVYSNGAEAALPKLDFHRVYVSPRSVELATQVLQSGWISEGPMAERFEQQLAATLGVQGPVSLNSGTSALHLALAAAGIGPDDEVILPAQTFVATGLAILMQHAVPVFADIDPRTGNISAASIAKRLTSRTKAIMVVHFGGYPCDLDEINALARQHNMPVIEDAAHALGATYKQRPLGTISRFTVFSFQATKHLTSGDGGLLCCPNEEDYHLARRLRWFGIDRRTDLPSLLGEREYHLSTLGFKYHMNDLAAAVALGNLEDFQTRLQRRQEIGALYRSELRNVAGVELLELRSDRTHAYWVFTIFVEGREQFIRKLAAHGIPASVVHLRIDRHALFGGPYEDLVGQARFEQRHISVPVHEGLTDADVERIVTVIRSGW